MSEPRFPRRAFRIPGARPASFRLDGARLEGVEGETLLAALLAGRGWELRRTESQDAPRGMFCGMGACMDCLVHLEGEGLVRACATFLREGMVCRTPRPAEGAGYPIEGRGERPPGGGPRGEWPEGDARAVIVGAGPAGLGAAVELAKRGVEPVLLDENPGLGGQIYKKPAGGVDPSLLAPPLESYAMGKSLLGEVRVWEGAIRHVPGATTLGVFEGRAVAYTGDGRARTLRAETLLLAPGAHARVIPFPGWTLPGVITVGGLQTLLKHHGILPGRRVVLAGSGLLSLLVAAQMALAGHPPAALIEATGLGELARALPSLCLRPSMIREGARLLRILRRAGVRVMRRRAAVRARGGGRVEEVEVAPLDGDWRPDLSRVETLEADCLATGFGLVPEVSLARLAGCTFDHRPELGGWVPRHGAAMETEREGVFVAGDSCGVRGAEIAQHQGRLAGLAMAGRLGAGRGGEDRAQARKLQRAIRRRVRARRGLERAFRVRPGIYEAMDGDTVLCRCEEVTWSEVREWLARGLRSATQIKMATRAGMGRCQGRFCAPNFRDLLLPAAGEAADLEEGLSARPPVRPVPLEALAEMAEE